MSAEARVPTRAAICAKYLRPCQLIKFGLLQHRASGRSSPILPLRRMGGVRKEVVGVFQMFLPFDGKRASRGHADSSRAGVRLEEASSRAMPLARRSSSTPYPAHRVRPTGFQPSELRTAFIPFHAWPLSLAARPYGPFAVPEAPDDPIRFNNDMRSFILPRRMAPS